MVAVREIAWEAVSAPDFGSRAAWRATVAEIAAKAHEKLPECAGRIDAAVKIVLAGDVELMPDGTARVASQSSGTTTYHILNGRCDCRDYEKAPHNFCKHRLAAAIARRAQELIKAKLTNTNGQVTAQSQPAPTTPLPEAPVSITLKATLHGHEVMVTLRGTDFASVKAQVEDASQWLQAQSGQMAADTPYCPRHGVAMQLNHGKNGSTWYSHKTAEGWCKGK
jgi:SWIM zinc finger